MRPKILPGELTTHVRAGGTKCLQIFTEGLKFRKRKNGGERKFSKILATWHSFIKEKERVNSTPEDRYSF